VAGQAERFLENFGWALAHAGGDADIRGIGHGRRLGLDRRGRRLEVGAWRVRLGRRRALVDTAAMASGLVAAALLAVGGGPVALTGQPAPPASCSILAGRATVACLGPTGQEPAFTPFEQTATAVGMPTTKAGWLTQHQGAGKLEMAHGRNCSRAVRRREGCTSRRPFAPTAGMASVGNRAARTSQITCSDSCLPRREGQRGPKPRSTNRGMAQLALRKWLSPWPLLTRGYYITTAV